MNTPNRTATALHDSQVLLWPDGAPHALGTDATDQPALTLHLPDPAIATGAAVIVNPGGGYRILAADHEGLQVARWLNRIGVVACVLRYRVGPRYATGISVLDGLRAVRYVRAAAADLGINPDRIGMLGFSAGGHLTAAVGTRWDHGNPAAADPIERVSARPDFIVPVYAVINGAVRGRKPDDYTPTEYHVTAATPPCFLMHTHQDATVPADQSLLFYRALLVAGVQAELHVFGHDDHGAGLAVGDPDTQHWIHLLQRWLRRIGMFTDKPRHALTGRVTLNGAVMGMYWLTLLPEDEHAPLAQVRGNRAGEGHFQLDQAAGPTAGWHTVQVHHLSEDYPHTSAGAYTLDDVARYQVRAHIAAETPLVLDLSEAERNT